MNRSSSLRPLSLVMAMGLLALLLTGCWNAKELNEIAVVLAVGIDSADGQYEVSVQVADPLQMSKNRPSDRAPITVFSQTSPTIFEALRKMTTESARKMYLSHIRLVVFDEQTARKGIKEPLDFLFRDHEVRPDFKMVVARGSTAKDVVSIITPTEILPAMDLYKSLDVSEKVWAPSSAVNVTEMMKKLTQSGVEPVMTWGTIIGKNEKGKAMENVKLPVAPSKFKYAGISVFRDDRLVGWLNASESKAYNYITNKVWSTVGRVECPHSEGLFVVEVKRSKVKIVPAIEQGEPHVRLKMNIDANLGEIECKVDVLNVPEFLSLQQAANAKLHAILTDGVQKIQAMESDILGFGDAFHHKYPRQWKQWQTDWNHRFKRLPVEIEIDYRIRHVGKILSPIGNNPENKER